MLSYLRNVREADGSRLDSEPWLEADGEGAIAAGERAHLKFGEVDEMNAQRCLERYALSRVSRRELR